MKCKFYSMINECCHNKDNKDVRSRLKSGNLRRFPKNCDEKFCPLKNKGERK